MSAKPEQKRKGKRDQAPKNVKHLTALFGCGRCAKQWNVVDLNPERKVVQCPVCAEPNDIREAINRGRGGAEHVKEKSI